MEDGTTQSCVVEWCEIITRVEDLYSAYWKKIETISSRIICTYDDKVLLECLIENEYEERIFNKSLFAGFDMKEDARFLLKIYEQKNEMKIVIEKNTSKIDDFPKIDFVEKFKNFRLFKKNSSSK